MIDEKSNIDPNDFRGLEVPDGVIVQSTPVKESNLVDEVAEMIDDGHYSKEANLKFAAQILELVKTKLLEGLPGKRVNINPGKHYRVCTPQQRENRGFNIALDKVTATIKSLLEGKR